MNRRQFLLGMGAMGATTAVAAAWKYWPSQGFTNPCRADMPARLANHELVQAAWAEIDPQQVWDSHVHLIGNGDSGSGVWINPDMDSALHPIQMAQKLFYLNAGCVHDAPGRVDQSYVERMHNLVDGMRPGFKMVILAFDYFHDEAGGLDRRRSAFHTPNLYAKKMAQRYPDYFQWAASIHPYRKDAVSTLDNAVANGAVAVKWLPAAMGIDPASARCDAFYEAMAGHNLPLITHAGRERAVFGADTQDYNNPLKLRRALEHNVRAVVAHCASDGQDKDLDRGSNGGLADSFHLFARLMDTPGYVGKVFGDISAITQINRLDWLNQILERSEWHGRLLNGSDYPLPGVMPLFSVDALVERGLVGQGAADTLKQIREYNPLLFDFVLKRHLASNAKTFAPSVFETRRFFEGKPI